MTIFKKRNSDFEQSETEEWQESEMMILNVVKMKNFKRRKIEFEGTEYEDLARSVTMILRASKLNGGKKRNGDFERSENEPWQESVRRNNAVFRRTRIRDLCDFEGTENE